MAALAKHVVRILRRALFAHTFDILRTIVFVATLRLRRIAIDLLIHIPGATNSTKNGNTALLIKWSWMLAVLFSIGANNVRMREWAPLEGQPTVVSTKSGQGLGGPVALSASRKCIEVPEAPLQSAKQLR
jgi:hypothetical protein